MRYFRMILAVVSWVLNESMSTKGTSALRREAAQNRGAAGGQMDGRVGRGVARSDRASDRKGGCDWRHAGVTKPRSAQDLRQHRGYPSSHCSLEQCNGGGFNNKGRRGLSELPPGRGWRCA